MTATEGFIAQTIKTDGLGYAIDRFNEMSTENRRKYKEDFINASNNKGVKWNVMGLNFINTNIGQ